MKKKKIKQIYDENYLKCNINFYKIVEETDRTQSIKWIEFITDRSS